MLETTALGAAIVAGSAKGVEVWEANKIQATPNDLFIPSISEDGKLFVLKKMQHIEYDNYTSF